jgi:HAD superfamily phosphatase (TIGR01668 family)
MLARLFSSSIRLTVRQRGRSRHSVQAFAVSTTADNLAAIDLKQLSNNKIYGIILDLDNTIVSEDDRYVSPGAEDWIQQARQTGFQCFILSNGKRRYRVEHWSQRLNVPAINPAKKPFPRSFRKAIRQMGLKPAQVVVIGDSRHTDILGAWLVGCPSIQVATLPHPFRWWEKLLGKRVQTPYPDQLDLWEYDDGDS